MNGPPRKRNASGGTLANSQSRDDDSPKGKSGRKENQRIAPDRNPGQSQPQWRRPAGADALDALARHWSTRRQR